MRKIVTKMRKIFKKNCQTKREKLSKKDKNYQKMRKIVKKK